MRDVLGMRRLAAEVARLDATVLACEHGLRGVERESKGLEADRAELRNRIHLIDHRVARMRADALGAARRRVRELLDAAPVHMRPGWDVGRWLGVHFEAAQDCSVVCIGEGLEADCRVPVHLPCIGGGKALFFEGVSSSAVMQGFLLRAAAALPHRVSFTFLDAHSEGRPFSVIGSLGDWVRPVESVDGALKRLEADVSRIVRAYLSGGVSSFEHLPQSVQVHERFEFVAVANYPLDLSDAELERLVAFGRNGPAAGRYLVVQGESAAAPIGGWSDSTRHVVDVDRLVREGVRLDGLPPQWLADRVMERVRASRREDGGVRFRDVIDGCSVWKESAADRVEATVGLTSLGEPVKHWFGVSGDGRPCAHGMLGAMTGAGKSNYFHVFILSLALRYSPRELNFYLIDGKDGVEFQVYRNLPHARVVALNACAELARSVLDDLAVEKLRRNEAFSRVAVTNFSDYRRAGEPQGKMARIVALIDEYQELFVGDASCSASDRLLELSRQARSAGIHLFVASQRFGAPGMRHQSAIFGNMHLRVAMKMTRADQESLSEFGRGGRGLIERCDLPGRVVLNDGSGDDGANLFGRVAYSDPKERREIVMGLRRRAPNLAPIVFDGNAQPKIAEHPLVRLFDERRRTPKANQWQAFASGSCRDGGLGLSSGDVALSLGREFTVYGFAHAALSRGRCENVLVAGGLAYARYGIVGASLVCLALQPVGVACRVVVINGGCAGAPWADGLRAACGAAARAFDVEYFDQSEEARDALGALRDELDRRKGAASSSGSLVFVVVCEVDLFAEFSPEVDRFGNVKDSELGGLFRRLFTEGPLCGIHVIAGFSRVAPAVRMLGKLGLAAFGHRVAMQCSDDDSYALIQSRSAARLQQEGARPIRAVYKDVNAGSLVRFKPYCIEDTNEWRAQLERLTKHIRERKKQ